MYRYQLCPLSRYLSGNGCRVSVPAEPHYHNTPLYPQGIHNTIIFTLTFNSILNNCFASLISSSDPFWPIKLPNKAVITYDSKRRHEIFGTNAEIDGIASFKAC
ncbi:hypothetical protein CEXT_715531 [Caerostris extrusa]|uniref:Uncharacterized protein n=1 Tax=Caerostris extrusa TaxID=172846 RepID=A0AAV4QBC2_CAEEX|nr:hypothetical protein CEXT_715531 [Caerostris extrusa]